MLTRLHERAHRRELDGHARIGKQRLIALLMIGTGLLRVAIWLLLILLYLAHVKFARNLYAEVSFVSLLSVLALLLTDWGQCAASLAQLSAEDAHADADAAHGLALKRTVAVEDDIAALADLEPGPAEQALAGTIRARLRDER